MVIDEVTYSLDFRIIDDIIAIQGITGNTILSSDFLKNRLHDIRENDRLDTGDTS